MAEERPFWQASGSPHLPRGRPADGVRSTPGSDARRLPMIPGAQPAIGYRRIEDGARLVGRTPFRTSISPVSGQVGLRCCGRWRVENACARERRSGYRFPGASEWAPARLRWHPPFPSLVPSAPPYATRAGSHAQGRRLLGSRCRVVPMPGADDHEAGDRRDRHLELTGMATSVLRLTMPRLRGAIARWCMALVHCSADQRRNLVPNASFRW